MPRCTHPPRYLSREPSRRNLTERQVDNFGRNAIFTNGDLVTGLRLAPDDRQRDRSEGGGDGRAADLADLFLTESQRLADGQRGLGAKSPQMPIRAAAVMKA